MTDALNDMITVAPNTEVADMSAIVNIVTDGIIRPRSIVNECMSNRESSMLHPAPPA
jgi:hypothetical protein